MSSSKAFVETLCCVFSSTAAKSHSASQTAPVFPVAHHRETVGGDVRDVPVSGSEQRRQSLEQHRSGQCCAWAPALAEQLGSSALSRAPSCRTGFPFLASQAVFETGGYRIQISKSYRFTSLAPFQVAPLIIVEEKHLGKICNGFVLF